MINCWETLLSSSWQPTKQAMLENCDPLEPLPCRIYAECVKETTTLPHSSGLESFVKPVLNFCVAKAIPLLGIIKSNT